MNKIKEGDIVEAQIEFTTSGNASIKLEGKEFFIHRKKTKNSLHLDTILAELFKGPKGKIEAKVLEVKERFKEDFVGTVHINGENVFVIPDNTKISVDFYIKGESDAKNGQKVLVKMINWEEGKKSPKAKITKILGEIGENNTEMNAIMYEYGLPVEFPQIVLNESELVPEVITEKEIKQRRDMRDVLTFTIDPEDAKDFDDALSIKKIGEGTYQIGVHIADVSHYVKFGTE